jgi:hypothetical protein
VPEVGLEPTWALSPLDFEWVCVLCVAPIISEPALSTNTVSYPFYKSVCPSNVSTQ